MTNFKKLLLILVLFLIGIVSPILISRAAGDGFVLVAISPTGQKAVCVKNNDVSVLAALEHNGFDPKQDETGFIYSLINYVGPISSDPVAAQNFWSFWIGDNRTFSNLGPSQVPPINGEIYLFNFGNGATPTTTIKYTDVCHPAAEPVNIPINNPAAPILTQPAGQPINSLTSSFQYLRDNFANASASSQDWAALALGSFSQPIAVANNQSDSVLSLARNVLASAAQGQDRLSQVQKIEASFSNNQLGDPNLINDDIFGLLAIQSTDPTWLASHRAIFETIIASQRSNGSFGFSKSGSGDVDITAAAIWPLIYNQPRPTAVINKAFIYISSAQNTDGGFGFQPGQGSNVATTSWVVLAVRAANQDSTRAVNYLVNNKQTGGYWLFAGQPNYLSTAYAVMALSGQTLPIIFKPATTSPTVPTPTQPVVLRPQPTSIVETATVTITETSSCQASASASAAANGDQATATATATASCN